MRVVARTLAFARISSVGHRRVAALGRPVQRRHAVALSDVHVGALRDQLAYGGEVAPHRRVGDGDGGTAVPATAATRMLNRFCRMCIRSEGVLKGVL